MRDKTCSPWHGLNATCVHIGDALANLAFPCLAEIGAVEARRQDFHEFGTLARRELQGGFEQSRGFGHGPQCSRLGKRVRCDEAALGGDQRVLAPTVMLLCMRSTGPPNVPPFSSGRTSIRDV